MSSDPATPDPVIVRARALFARSNLSLEEVGRRMGYGEDTARKATWQLLNKTNNPRVETLRRFADALGVPLRDLFDE